MLAALAAVVAAIRHCRSGRWRRGLSHLVLPAFVLAAACMPRQSINAIDLAGDMIHFQMMRRHYLAGIAAMPTTKEPRLVLFPWGGWLMWTTGVVYDESDEIVLPPGAQSAGWHDRAKKTELGCPGYAVHPVGDHFYLANIIC